MMDWFRLSLALIAARFRSRAELETELLALRHQLAVYQRSDKRPRLRPADRVLWSALSRLSGDWRQFLFIVQPETVIRWRRRKFREHWARLSKRGPGRPRVSRETRDLIADMSRANALWGAPRIMGELRAIGIEVSKSTVETYMVRMPHGSGQGWFTFLRNHSRHIVSIDFFIAPTARYDVLYVFVVLENHRRKIRHIAVTAHPTAEWTARQLLAAFSFEDGPRYLQRDRDGIYGHEFQQLVRTLGTRELISSPRSPWQNPYVERVIGSIRRECLDHVIVLNERHLIRVLREYVAYYNERRCHQALEFDTPAGRAVQHKGRVVPIPHLGGLYHHYERQSA